MPFTDVYDMIGSVLLLALIGLAVMGPMVFLLWYRARKALEAMRRLRDKIDGTQHWP